MWGVQDIEEGKIRKVFSSQMSECDQKGRITRLILEVSEIMNLFWWFIMAQWLTSQIDNENDKITFLWVHFWKQWMCSWPPTFCRHHNTIYKLDHSLQVCAIVSVNLKLLSNYIWRANKTIGDEGITVDFWIIKIHTSNWSLNSWGSSNSWDHRIVGDHRVPLDHLGTSREHL